MLKNITITFDLFCELIKNEIKKNSFYFEELINKLGDNKELINKLIDNEELVKIAVKHAGSLSHVSDRLKNKKDIVLKAIKENEHAIYYASETLRDDPDFCIRAGEFGCSLVWISDRLRDDNEVVIRFLFNDPKNLEFASLRIKNDREFLLKWVNESNIFFTCDLEFVSYELRGNLEFVKPFIENNENNMKFVSDMIKDNFDFAKEVITKLNVSLKWFSCNLKNNRELVLIAINEYHGNITHISDKLKSDYDFVNLIVCQNINSFEYLSKSLQHNYNLIYKYFEEYEYLDNFPEKIQNELERFDVDKNPELHDLKGTVFALKSCTESSFFYIRNIFPYLKSRMDHTPMFLKMHEFDLMFVYENEKKRKYSFV